MELDLTTTPPKYLAQVKLGLSIPEGLELRIDRYLQRLEKEKPVLKRCGQIDKVPCFSKGLNRIAFGLHMLQEYNFQIIIV